jgi:hypothetical protein
VVDKADATRSKDSAAALTPCKGGATGAGSAGGAGKSRVAAARKTRRNWFQYGTLVSTPYGTWMEESLDSIEVAADIDALGRC